MTAVLQRATLRLHVVNLLAQVAAHYPNGTRYKVILPNDIRWALEPETATFLGLRVEWDGQPGHIVVAPDKEM